MFLALARCMVGQHDQAVASLRAGLKAADKSQAYLQSRLLGGLTFAHLLSGELHAARIQAQRLWTRRSRLRVPAVGCGHSLNPARHSEIILDSLHIEPLTNRELDIIELLAQRLQSKEIADRPFISTHTVNAHLKRIYRKIGVTSRREAVERAVRAGLIERR